MTVLAPADAAVWNRAAAFEPNDIRRGPTVPRPEWVEICGTGPVRLGRRDEPVTEGRP